MIAANSIPISRAFNPLFFIVVLKVGVMNTLSAITIWSDKYKTKKWRCLDQLQSMKSDGKWRAIIVVQDLSETLIVKHHHLLSPQRLCVLCRQHQHLLSCSEYAHNQS